MKRFSDLLFIGILLFTIGVSSALASDQTDSSQLAADSGQTVSSSTVTANASENGNDGSAGYSSYYQQELGNFGTGAGKIGPDGSITYRYPMGDVALVYSSASGGSWNLSGGGVITRDVKWGVPRYDDQDIFLLDGGVLVRGAGTNPVIYHTRRESYARIEYFNPGTSSSYWKVTLKDGTRKYYGADAGGMVQSDARIKGRTETQPRAWALKEVRDAGNYHLQKFIYWKDTSDNDSEYVLKYIISGKTGAAGTGYRMTGMVYEFKPESTWSVSYREGMKTANNRRVKYVIEITGCDLNGAYGVPSGGYQISWEERPVTKRSMVASILSYGSDITVTYQDNWYLTGMSGGTSFPPTTFTYSTMNLGFGKETNWGTHGGNTKLRCNKNGNQIFNYMDMNGDGLPDRVAQNQTNRLSVYLNTGSSISPNCTDFGVTPGEWLGNNNSGYIDMNGDGLPDRVMKEHDDNPYAGKLLRVWPNLGSSFGPEQTWSSLPDNDPIRCLTMASRIDCLDMNGDGLPDRVWQYPLNDYQQVTDLNVHLNTGESIQNTITNYGSTIGNFLRNMVFTGDMHTIADYIDINGDGLPDRIYVNYQSEQCEKVFLNTGSGFVEYNHWDFREGSIRDSAGINSSRYDLMDVNGDGLPDQVWMMGELQVSLNTGNGFGPFQTLTGIPSNFGNYQVWLRRGDGNTSQNEDFTLWDFMDMNGDGLLDRVYEADDGLHVWLNNSTTPSDCMLTAIDHDSGGRTVYAYKPVDRSLNPGYKIKSWVVSQETVNDGFSNIGTIFYEFSGGYYSRAKREDRGFAKARMITPTGKVTETYYYQDDLRAGLVMKTIVRDHTGNIFSYQYNDYGDLTALEQHYGRGLSQKRRVGGILSENLGKETVNAVVQILQDIYIVDGGSISDTGISPGGANWKRQRVCTPVSPDYWDCFGNNLRSDSGDYTEGIWGQDLKKTFTRYTNSGGSPWLFLPSQVIVYAVNRNGQETIASQKFINYDGYSNGFAVNGLVSQTYLYKDSGSYISTQNTYDQFGNIVGSADANGNVTGYTYDPVYKSYPIKVSAPAVNGIIFDTTYGYDSWMRVIQVTDANNNRQGIRYDVFGCKIKSWDGLDSETYPTEVIEYHQADGSTANDGTPFAWVKLSGRITTGQPNTVDQLTYYDGLGRIVENKQEIDDTLGNSIWQTVDYWRYYQDRQEVQAESLPRQWGTMAYDRPAAPSVGSCFTKSYLDNSRGRVTETIDPKGNSTYVYQKLYTSLKRDPMNRVVLTETIPVRNERKITECAGVFPNHTPYALTVYRTTFDRESIINHNGNVSYTDYDWLGRKTVSVDPDRGSSTYNYDGNGNLTGLTDAENQTVVYAYDAHNRVILKETGETTRYYYDGDDDDNRSMDRTGMKGCLGYITDSTGWTKLDYDSRGRVTAETKYINGSVMKQTGYQYNSRNQLTAIRYPDGATAVYRFDRGGKVNGLDTDSGTIIQNILYNEFGKTDTLYFGNNTGTRYLYYGASENCRLYKIAAWDGKGVWMMSSIYTYDNAGNILSINDPFESSTNQTFDYDALYRLTGQTNAGYTGGLSSFVYDPIGNLKMKNGLSYTYHAGTHQVASVSDGTYTAYYRYDAKGNLVEKTGSHPTRDHTPPVVEITDPIDGVNVPQGQITVNANASDNNGLVKVEFYVDGVLLATRTASPYRFVWNTTGYSPGVHTIKAVAYDAEGNPGIDQVDVTLANQITKFGFGAAGDGGGTMFGTIPWEEPQLATDGETKTPTYASVLLKERETSQGLYTYDYRFNIAADVLITGVQVDVTAYSGSAEVAYFNAVRMFQEDFLGEDRAAGQQITSKAFRTYSFGGPADTWGINLTPDQLNDSGFGVMISCGQTGDSGSVYVESVKVTVYFKTGGNVLFSDGAKTMGESPEPGTVYPVSYGYDRENRLTSVTDVKGTSCYSYDYSGRRTIKVENGVTTYYFNQYYEVENGTPVKYYYVNGQRIARDKGGIRTWYHLDHLNGSNRITDSTGTEIRRIGYQPFGEDSYNTGSGNPPDHKYTGQENDSATGLYYYGGRYYNPLLCRFIQADTVYDKGPQGLNLYSYCLNNPIRYNDPTGHNADDGWEDGKYISEKNGGNRSETHSTPYYISRAIINTSGWDDGRYISPKNGGIVMPQRQPESRPANNQPDPSVCMIYKNPIFINREPMTGYCMNPEEVASLNAAVTNINNSKRPMPQLFVSPTILPPPRPGSRGATWVEDSYFCGSWTYEDGSADILGPDYCGVVFSGEKIVLPPVYRAQPIRKFNFSPSDYDCMNYALRKELAHDSDWVVGCAILNTLDLINGLGSPFIMSTYRDNDSFIRGVNP